MAVDPSRWRDIVLAPCNQSAERRNWAATKEALQALAENPATAEPTATTGSDLRFFQVATSNVGGDNCSVIEVVFNAGTSEWEATGATFTAWDWTPTGAFKQNFVADFYGIGRINEEVGSDALEVLAIEGYARFIQGTATGGMSGGTVTVTVDDYWGDPLNGRTPGASTEVHDTSNNAPNLENGDTVLAVLDEKRQFYVLIAPHKGSQPPGSTAIVQVRGGDAGLGCADSVTKNSLCLYTGKKADISAQALIDEDFCAEQFDDGQNVWILDARHCRSVNRLTHLERYVGVSMLEEWDPDPGGPGTDPRPLYAVVDASPSVRWFRMLSNAEAIVQDGQQNDLRCRDCNDDETSDDCPSAWGKWRDRNPCEFDVATVPDPTPVLVYFPMHRLRCSTLDEQAEGGYDECTDTDVDPFCRNNELVLAFWNPISERWEAITDIEKCINLNGNEVAHIVVCSEQAEEDCCVYDAVAVKYSPRNNSYCLPKTERERVWVRCANGFVGDLPIGYCRIGVKICNRFECNGENRKAFMFDCGNCPECACPDVCDKIQYRMYTDNPNDDCGAMVGEIEGIMECVDRNPVLDNLLVTNPGWWAEFEVVGLEPRLLYIATADYNGLTDAEIHLEIVCGGTGHTPGTIINKFDPDGDLVSGSVTFKTGLTGCLPMLDAGGDQMFRVRTYRYGLWAKCTTGGSMQNVQVFWLKNDEMLGGTDTQEIDPGCSEFCDVVPEPREVATGDAIWGDGGFAGASPCCANSVVVDRDGTGGVAIECGQDLTDIGIIGIGSHDEGLLTCPGNCFHGVHNFAGCPCVTYESDGSVPHSGGPSGHACGENWAECVATKWYLQLEWAPVEGLGPSL